MDIVSKIAFGVRKNFGTFVLILVLFCSAGSFAQSSHRYKELTTTNPKAKRAFFQALNQSKNKVELTKKMRSVIKIDKTFVEPYWVIAERSNPAQTIEILNLAIENKAYRLDETRLMLIDTYSVLGQYRDAAIQVNLISDQNPQKQQLIDRFDKIIKMLNDTVEFAPVNVKSANSTLDEYFPSVTADDKILSITTSKKYGSFVDQEDMAYSKKMGERWMPFIPIDNLNTIDNEGSQTISADGRYMFFVGCNRADTRGSCDIYYSINTDGNWSYPINPGQPLNTENWETNPSLSPAGNELFFATNRDGNSDIWKCDVEIMEDGKLRFSNPKSLGKVINTQKNDYAPFIHSDNRTLYFLSNGHIGFGGSDIFVSHRDTSGNWSVPTNLGYPINTNDNAYGFTLSGDGKKGYISLLNKENPKMGLDIYEFELHQAARPTSMTYIVGNVYDAQTQNPLNAIVQTFDYASQKAISKTLSDKKTGEFTTFLPTTGQYGLNVKKMGYLFYSFRLIPNGDSLKVYLQPIQTGAKIILNNIFFDFNSDNLDSKSEKEILELAAFLNKNPSVSIIIIGHTDNIGSDKFNLSLSENRAAAVVKSLINKGIPPDRLLHKGMGAAVPIQSNDTEQGRAANRRVEFEIR